jgi:hypothetical protein
MITTFPACLAFPLILSHHHSSQHQISVQSLPTDGMLFSKKNKTPALKTAGVLFGQTTLLAQQSR